MDANIQTPQQVTILQKLSLVEEALLTQDPRMRDHLKEIHKLLIGYEELTHLLTDEQIAVIMGAQQIQTNTSLIAATTGKKAATGVAKKAAKLGMGDL